MKDTLIKELTESSITRTSISTNVLDKEYNDLYDESYKLLFDSEIKEIKESKDINVFVHKKIKGIPPRIKFLIESREDAESIVDKAKFNSEIDVLNIFHTKYIEATSKLAIK